MECFYGLPWSSKVFNAASHTMTTGICWNNASTQVPDEVNQLFTSMWNRLWNDKKLYRAHAALRFNLVLDWESCGCSANYSCWKLEHRTGTGFRNRPCFFESFDQSGDITLIRLTLASHRFAKGPQIKRLGTDMDSIWNMCLDTYTRVPIL